MRLIRFQGRSRRILATAAAVGLLTGLPLTSGDAWAGNKPKLKATINGKRFKSNVRQATLSAFDPGTDVVTINGLFQKVSLSKGTIKTLQIILNIDLESATFPVSVAAGIMAFTDNTFTGPVPPPVLNAWGGEGVTVNIDSFNGSTLKGSFEGTIPPGDVTPLPPATVENGKFKLPVMNLAQP